MNALLRVLWAVLAATAWLGAGPVAANPVTYTGFVVTDVSLNGAFYHNASVQLTFAGDTSNLQWFAQTGPNGASGSGWQITQGCTSVLVTSGSVSIQAQFAPGQIIVSYDWYNGGAGFSSLVGSDHHLEPAYPLGLDGGAITSLPDLQTTGSWTGHAWSCIGFPPSPGYGTGSCADPTAYPLQTDHGPFVIYMPYFMTNATGTINNNSTAAVNAGLFSVSVQ
jgi:hypothetical protein